MALWILLNATSYEVTASGAGAGLKTRLLAGTVINDAITPTANITAAGGVLWPAADVTVSAAAAAAQSANKNAGADEGAMNTLLLTSALASLQTGSGGIGSVTLRQSLVLNLAGIKALTSGTAFNVGAALPANARLLGAEAVWTAVTGGSLSDVELIVGDATTTNSVMTTTNVHSGSSSKGVSAFQSRGGAQIQATLTATGDTLANATAGAVAINLLYVVD